MHKLLARQLKKVSAKAADGEVDYERLLELVSDAYDEADSERKLNQRTLALMSDEMLELNQSIKEEAEARQQAQEQLIDAIETQREGFAFFDADDRLMVCNSRYKEFYFPGAEESIQPGMTFEEVTRTYLNVGAHAEPVSDPEAWVRERMARHDDPKEQFERRVGGGRWVLVSERRTRDGGVVSVHTDITARKEAEQEIVAAKEHAEFANRSKSEFLANMSHELRTPLNAVIGFSEMMMTAMLGPLSEQYLDYAKDINDSGIHLLTLINDLLDLSKIEAGKFELREEETDVAKLIDGSLRIIKERAHTAGVKIDVQLPEVSPMLLVDQRALKQILLNLLSNAVKFTPEGGTITVRVDKNPQGELRLGVGDTGIGIAADNLAKVLTPFGQVDSALSRKHAGTGLGLPLVKSLIELHGGSLEISSEINVGTEVVVRFPSERLLAA